MAEPTFQTIPAFDKERYIIAKRVKKGRRRVPKLKHIRRSKQLLRLKLLYTNELQMNNDSDIILDHMIMYIDRQFARYIEKINIKNVYSDIFTDCFIKEVVLYNELKQECKKEFNQI